MKRQGTYFLDEAEKAKVAAVILRDGGLNPRIVGRSPHAIAKMARLSLPASVRLMIAEETGVGRGVSVLDGETVPAAGAVYGGGLARSG